ncbi:MAG: hypothetical protein BIFFINMI_00915 [Phycisphaerae bacterium]|nr:hypothetical protein [Phycisphaerae bacterium]
MKCWLLMALAVVLWAAYGCEVKHDVKVEPIEIKPIHITMDINIKVDREVDAFFGDVEKRAAELNPPAETQPSTGDNQ